MSFAGVSIVGEGNGSRSAAAAAAGVTDSGYHLLVVQGYSRTKGTPNGTCITSQQFRVGGHPWLIEYYPNGSEPDEDGYISLYLMLDDDHAAEPVMAQYEFSFVDQVEEQEPSRIRATQARKFSSDDTWGYPCFEMREHLERSKHLKDDDSFTVRCDIVVVVVTGGGAPSPSTLTAPPPGIQQHLSSLLLSGVGADVTFQVGGETFVAHRCVLAARSSVFRAELFGPMKESTATGVIHVDGIEPQVFKLLLAFIYSDSVPEIHGDDGEDDDDDFDYRLGMWQHLFVAADMYDLQKLRLICQERLCGLIHPTTVAGIRALAEQHYCKELEEACVDFVNSNLQECMIVLARLKFDSSR
ncbi:hypothetical protein ACP70R_021278 [Stipagrostis hirtigluma subsp. patula]